MGGHVAHGERVRVPATITAVGGEALVAWRELVAWLVEGGIMDRSDRMAIEQCALAIGLLRDLHLELHAWRINPENKLGLRTRSARGTTMHPAIAASREQATVVRLWLTELGLTPAARTKVVPPPPDDPGPQEGEGRIPRRPQNAGDRSHLHPVGDDDLEEP